MASIDPKKHLTILERYKISLAEWTVLSTIGTWPLPQDVVARTAANQSEGDPRGTVTESACQEALASSLRKKWLRVVDDQVLQEIRAFLREQPGLGPVYGLPVVGDVDFTPMGARLFHEVRKELFGGRWAADHAYEKEHYCRRQLYTRTKKGMQKALAEIKRRRDVISVTEPVSIGLWRVYWWETYPTGFCIEMETRILDERESEGDIEGEHGYCQ